MVAKTFVSPEQVSAKVRHIEDNKLQLSMTPRSIESLMKYFGGTAVSPQSKTQKKNTSKISTKSEENLKPKNQSNVKRLTQMYNGRIKQLVHDQASAVPSKKSANNSSKTMSSFESIQETKIYRSNSVPKQSPGASMGSPKIRNLSSGNVDTEIGRYSVKDKIQFFNQMTCRGAHRTNDNKSDIPRNVFHEVSNKSSKTVEVLSRKFESCAVKSDLGRSTSPSETSITWSHRSVPKAKTSTPNTYTKEIVQTKEELSSQSVETLGASLSFKNNSDPPPSTRLKRRSRAERNHPRKFFINEHLEQLFYEWLKHRNIDACDYENCEIIESPEMQSIKELPEKDCEVVQSFPMETEPSKPQDNNNKAHELNAAKPTIQVIDFKIQDTSSSRNPKVNLVIFQFFLSFLCFPIIDKFR